MLRASICISSDSPTEESAFGDWRALWEEKLTFFSDDFGCGCCVHLYDVEGPIEAIESIPKELRAESDWSKGVETKK